MCRERGGNVDGKGWKGGVKGEGQGWKGMEGGE